MARTSRILCLALAGFVAGGCADEPPTATRHVVVAVPTTTTTARFDVAETGFPVTTAHIVTTAAVVTTTTDAPPADPCDAPPAQGSVPTQVTPRCDGMAGWRISAWIGASGDGIIYLERHLDGAWKVVEWGPFCGGVAAITESDLRRLGVPADLAVAWSVADGQCAGNG